MTILRRIALGYSVVAVASLITVAWLGYHEFVEEPAEYAAKGLKDVHQDTMPEASAVVFCALVPLLLGGGWWWLRRVLLPLQSLTQAVESVDTHNLRQPLPRTFSGDEVDKLTAVFNSMTARLDDSIQQIREFTLQASHELKTPLTVMRGQLEVALRAGDPLATEQRAWMESQLGEIERLSKIVDALTMLARADSGALKFESTPTPLGELVREAFDDAQILAQPAGVTVTMETCEDVMVSGDRPRLRQLLLILTDNAVKYNWPYGFLQFSLRQVAGTAELRVVNSSAGIAPASQSRVFDRFVRGENAQAKVEGSGLGLSIAKSIVTAHGGTISLTSEPGKQTTVIVRFPSAPRNVEAHEAVGPALTDAAGI